MPIEMRRGDTPDFDIEVKEPPAYEDQPWAERDPYDLAGCTIWLTAKRKVSDSDADALFQLSTTNGKVVVTDAANGLCTATPAATDTSGLTTDVQGVYDVQVRTAGSPGRTFTVIGQDTIAIFRDITRA